jgi:hypothetical protein
MLNSLLISGFLSQFTLEMSNFMQSYPFTIKSALTTADG